MAHLIANSGIQFLTAEIVLNPDSDFKLNSNKSLQYYFGIYNMDPIDDQDLENFTFDQLYEIKDEETGDAKYIPFSQIINDNATLKDPNSSEIIDELGLIGLDENVNINLYTQLSPDELTDDDPAKIFKINKLSSYKRSNKPAYERWLNKWLPVPMFEQSVSGITDNFPIVWCRMKMEEISKLENGQIKYRLIWAFDTQTTDDFSDDNFPMFCDTDGEEKTYTLSNRTDQVFSFLSMENPITSKFSRYLTKLLDLDIDSIIERIESGRGIPSDLVDRYYFIAYYSYFINLIRLKGACPEVKLYNKTDSKIDVDLVIDVGNSRTCGVLFENENEHDSDSDFTRSQILELVDLTNPHKKYKDSIDMRIVFRKADFGNDIALVLDQEQDQNRDAFQWNSFVRIGEEAKSLIYSSEEYNGLSQLTTNYSSPKRYLWDDREFDGEWYNIVRYDDPDSVKEANNIYLKMLSPLFDKTGVYSADNDNLLLESKCKYSRQSLMTFVFIEILQQAILQINSQEYRNHIGRIDCRRQLRNIIITCPTAMPISEQKSLRTSAQMAYNTLRKINPLLNDINIIPQPQNIGKSIDSIEDTGKVAWSYDEASCCQLVYLYGEIVEKYNGEVERLFKELVVNPQSDTSSLVIGTIDIGAGTTDVIINKYKFDSRSVNTLKPLPLYWDSFYVAGDDILQKLVQYVVIDGESSSDKNSGSIYSAVTNRILELTNEELMNHASVKNSLEPAIYQSMIDNICKCCDEYSRNAELERYASVLVDDFFAKDKNTQSARHRKLRAEFNTQVSVPIAQKMMDLLRNKNPYKAYSFEEIFSKYKPSEYLLKHFEGHFGFSFTELLWTFDPSKISSLVQSVMEPLLKQISIIIDAFNCDVLILAGRPTSLEAITSLFLKFFPISPDKLVCLNNTGIGHWYPFENDPCGQKAVVAVGALVAHLASRYGFKGLSLDLSEMKWNMKSTANYIGEYDSGKIKKTVLTPKIDSAIIEISNLNIPTYVGCKQYDAITYQARPMYVIKRTDPTSDAILKYKTPLRVELTRDYENKEVIKIASITDANDVSVNSKLLEIRPQTIVDDGFSWLDKGGFEISVK